jgi:hypothetical protein
MGLHMFTAAQKTKCREVVRCMLETLESHIASNIHFLWAGKE